MDYVAVLTCILRFLGAMALYDGWLSRVETAVQQNKEARLLLNNVKAQ